MPTDERHSAECVAVWKVFVVSVQPGVEGDWSDLAEHLGDGWEPFAVTWDGNQWDYHLRRHIDGGGADG